MSDDKALLWLAIEDYAGLWEAMWELRPLHPDADDGELRERSRRELGDLIDRGLVELYLFREPTDDMWPADAGEVDALLDADANWMLPEGDTVSVRFSATTAGELSCGVVRPR